MTWKKTSRGAKTAHTAKVVGYLGKNSSIVKDPTDTGKFCVEKGTFTGYSCFNADAVEAFTVTPAEWLTTSKAAKILGVSYQTLVKWSLSGKFPAIEGTPGRNRRFDSRKVEALAATFDKVLNDKELLTGKETAYRLGVPYGTISKLVKQKILPVAKITPAGGKRFHSVTVEAIATARANAMTVGEVAILLVMSPRTVIKLADKGDFGAITWTEGGHRRFDRRQVALFEKARFTDKVKK